MSEKSEKPSEPEVPTLALDPRCEIQSLLHVAGGHGSVKERIGRAARRVGLGWSRTKDLWYADPRAAVRADELEKARRAALKAAQHEYQQLTGWMARLEAAYRFSDPDFHSPQIDALRDVARDAHRAVDRGEE